MDAKLNFGWIIMDNLAASSVPRNESDLGWIIKTHGLNYIITLTEKSLTSYVKNFRKIKANLGFKHYFIPTDDGTGFFPHQYDKIIKIYNQAQEKNHSVLLHCEGGYGRTSTALTAIWIYLFKKTIQKSIQELSEVRSQIMLTPLQLESLYKWEKTIQN